MIQKQFIDQVVKNITRDSNVVGLAVGGSYISNEIDEYSDVDLILVTKEKVAPDVPKMMAYAKSFGNFISGFTGEHVGEGRLLICLYDNPLLHVDIKFLTPDELKLRVEDPVIYWARDETLQNIMRSTKPAWPKIDYQWIEDRFWTWIHYATLKLGRGENFEALDFLSFMRTTVTAPLLQIKNGQRPNGIRKIEFNLDKAELEKLIDTAPAYSARSIFESLANTIKLYQELRRTLYPATIQTNPEAEGKTLDYLARIKRLKLG